MDRCGAKSAPTCPDAPRVCPESNALHGASADARSTRRSTALEFGSANSITKSSTAKRVRVVNRAMSSGLDQHPGSAGGADAMQAGRVVPEAARAPSVPVGGLGAPVDALEVAGQLDRHLPVRRLAGFAQNDSRSVAAARSANPWSADAYRPALHCSPWSPTLRRAECSGALDGHLRHLTSMNSSCVGFCHGWPKVALYLPLTATVQLEPGSSTAASGHGGA